MYDVYNCIVSDFMSLPEIVRGDCANRHEYFAKLYGYIDNMDVVSRQFIRFVASIDLKSYSPRIFESVNGNAL